MSWICPDQLQKDGMGSAGICSTPFGYAVGFRKNDNRSGIYLFDHELSLLATYHCKDVVAIHSMIWCETALYVVSTLSDAVYKLSFDRLNRITDETLLWAVDNDFPQTGVAAHEERHHINSITLYDKRLAVSLFGEPGWKHSQSTEQTPQGKVVFIDNNEIVMDSLDHPHSIQVLDGRLVVCEAMRGRVLLQSGAARELRGYLRGLTADETYIYVAASALRGGGFSLGYPFQGPHCSSSSVTCEIFVLERSSLNPVHRRQVRIHGPEIYDLLVPTMPISQSALKENSHLRVMELEEMAIQYKSVVLDGSRSWKLPRPMRRLGRFVRGLIANLDSRGRNKFRQIGRSPRN